MLFLGAVLICLLSIAASFIWSRVKSTLLAIACSVLFPVLACWPIYWIPLAGVTDKSEYGAWFGVFLVTWIVPAIPTSVAMTLLVRYRSKRNEENAG